MTVRGGGARFVPWLLCRGKEWGRRFGGSCRCGWLHHGSGPWTHRIQGCGAIDPRPKAGSPLIVIPIAPSVPSGSKLSRCGGKGGACRKVGVRRPTLTAPARRRERSAGRDEGMIAPVEQRDGTKERKRWR